ncbi:integral membrane protein [Streptomyces hygroscopicus]|uniref:LPXTG cell wall anchor domain-containing protein n=1 Tax=Streptomyces hygroscopicus TaxID=1912 RepID=UPI0022400D47|nr:LPXTG cell wall anchor domain-containing protein [Streptomyces hygroscopicus]MCW7944967.1 integral membrane protein [Streptomyces hygroscopicus]
MKLRRALAAAAATAAIAPLALLSAPAAFAADPSSSASASETAGTGSPTDLTPGAAASTTPAGGASTSASSSATTPSTPTGKPSGSASTSATPSAGSTPTAEPTPCTMDEVDPDSQLTISVSGLPGKIVAGSGWHPFTLTAANHSNQSLGEVNWLAIVDNDTASENEKDWLSTYAVLEYFNPKTKAWESIADEVGNGFYFGETELGPKQTVAIKLRVDITAKAPAGQGYNVGLGGYVDQAKNCVHNAFDYYTFTVLKPGTANDNPGQAKPGKGPEPAGGKKPQGGAGEIPATGSLASTGSSSALPTIALVGGVAVVAGGGVVFAVRRRKTGGQAA